MSEHKLRRRIRIEAVLAACFLVLAVITLISMEWIEALTGLEPDGGSGSLEWAITAGFGVAALVTATLARRDVRRLRLLTA